MGFWFNNFVEFERRQKAKNKLILNFHYFGGSEEKDKNVKVLVDKNVKVPTDFITQEVFEEVKKELDEKGFYNSSFKNVGKGKFYVLNLEIPNEHFVLNELPRCFQIGNYDKLLRYGGFYPERKVTLEGKLEKLFRENERIELENLSGMTFGDFLSEEELKSLPYLIIDIEKPLWKKDGEKRNMKWKENLLKQEKKYNKLSREEQELMIEKHEKRKRIIKKLEESLALDVDGVGKINLYDLQFNADISFVGTIWGNKEKIVKELYVIDPHDEITKKEHNGFNIIKFENEKELIGGLLNSLHTRKPLISYGHNQVYDITQLRFAAENNNLLFDPFVKEIKPRRDFVRSFLQRLREDTIYLDTLWLGKIFYPFLNQKRFGTSFKLAKLAQFLDINFSKSQTHEELRFTELRRLAGMTKEIREKAIEDMVFYSCADLDVTEAIVDKMNFIPLISKMKQVLPFCTMTEIAFSPNCMDKAHEFRHFKESGNLPDYGYKAKEKQDKSAIFKKRFPGIKDELLKWVELKKAKKGTYSNVGEFYIPLEEWTCDIAFKINPQLKEVYNGIYQNEKLPFLQYIKSFTKEIFIDYYFARRNERVYGLAKKFLKSDDGELQKMFEAINMKIEKKEIDRLKGSFKYLKNHFRSVYSALDGNGRKLIRSTKNNLLNIKFPDIMKEDCDLYLLRKNSQEIEKSLSSFNQGKLKSFLNNFETFEKSLNSNSQILQGNVDCNPNDLLYAYIYFNRMDFERRKFYAKYSSSIDELKNKIGIGYKNLSKEIKEKNLKFLDSIGNYILLQGDANLNSAIKIRNLETFVVE